MQTLQTQLLLFVLCLGYFVLMLGKSLDFVALRLISSKYLEYNTTKTTCLFYEVMIQAQGHL